LGRPFPVSFTVEVGDVPAGELGEARPTAFDAQGQPTAGTVVVSADAAGHGWFIDPTPGETSEFPQSLTNSAFAALPGSAAYGHYDLLTVLLHELGHLEGFMAANPGFDAHVQTIAGSQLFVGPGFGAKLTDDGNHLDNQVYHNDLMNDALEPS